MLRLFILLVFISSCTNEAKDTSPKKDNDSSIKVTMNAEKNAAKNMSCDTLFDNYGKCIVSDKRAVFNIPIGKSPVKGNADALVTIVEFSDFQCPACKGWSNTVFPALFKKYPGKLRHVFKHFPLNFHDMAKTAAQIGVIVQLKKGSDAFWKYHDLVFESKSDLTLEILISLAASAGVNSKVIAKELENNDVRTFVENDLKLGNKLSVGGTPWVYINGELFSGNASIAVMIERKIKEAQALEKSGIAKEKLYETITGKGTPVSMVKIPSAEYMNLLSKVRAGFLAKCKKPEGNFVKLLNIMKSCAATEKKKCDDFVKCVELEIKKIQEGQ
ncbi:MAG: thioredoxin domain-containing protein [Deltaproteobacteria bacterium]|nr:thioredoxin domain-containing protein [Deltaproteobacteria bacterium]